ncbi:MAG: efflux RND transporter periplasmic adaptor subunit [Oleiphilaceae bacterium]|nr:efflux RND transporter periplasmic adaptor subunit [Oleiphilaceae bacterium]
MPENTFSQFLYNSRWALGIILVAVLIIMLLIVTIPEPPTTATTEKAWLVESAEVSLGAHHPFLQIIGKTESPQVSTLSSALVADITHVPVREGQAVQAGDLLIQLDERDLKLKQQQLEADVKDIEAQIATEKNRYASDQRALAEEQKLLSIAEQALARQARLKASNLVAQERYEQAESERARAALAVSNRQQALADHPARLKQLQARLLRATNALDQARLDLERTRIVAPFDAWITRVDISVGERVQTGQSLLELFEPGSVEVRTPIPDRYTGLLRKALQQDQPVTATARTQGQPVQLALSRLSARTNPQSGSVDALFVPTNPQAALSLGASLTVQVQLPVIEQIASLPISALYGENRIYRINDERLETLQVDVVGHQFDAQTQKDRLLVRSPELNDGDLIITTQLPNAIDGLKVQRRAAP